MSLSLLVKVWLVDTITVAEQTGVDASGDPTFAAQTTMPGRILTRQENRLGTDQNEYLSNQQVATLTEIGLTARVWLPGDNTANNEEARRPINTESAHTKDDTTTLYMTYL